jgi:uncharacterized protein GlcG (DUF336 family)
MLDGGIIFESHGQLVGATGVSGAPSGTEYNRCAKTGVDAFRESPVF